MNCEQNIERYLQLDDYTHLPLSFRMHMLVCSSCRKEMRAMRTMMLEMQQDAPFESPEFSDQIMRSIRNISSHYNYKITTWQFVIPGLVIFSSIFLFSFSEAHHAMNAFFGSSFEVPFNIVMGTIVSVYSSLFILLNLEKLKSVLHLQ